MGDVGPGSILQADNFVGAFQVVVFLAQVKDLGSNRVLKLIYGNQSSGSNVGRAWAANS